MTYSGEICDGLREAGVAGGRNDEIKERIRMNILFVYSSLTKGGAERVIASLANSFAGENEVSIATLDNFDSEYDLQETVKHVKLDIARKSTSIADKFRNISMQKRILHDIIREISPDVIVAFDPKIAYLCRRASKGSVPVIGSERSNPYYARKGILSNYFVRKSGKLDGFIFQTNGAKTYYPTKIQKKSIVIPNGVFSPLTVEPEEYQNRKKVICGVGRLVSVKRFDVLLHAFGKIAEKMPDYEVRLYGIGDCQPELENICRENGIADRVHFMGLTDDVSRVLCYSRIYVLSSESEGMPNGLIEAMACGCACIASDCDFGPAELITPGQDGMLFPVGDVDRLADCILQLATDDGLAEKISGQALKVNQTLSLEQIAGRYYRYIQQVCSGQGGNP